MSVEVSFGEERMVGNQPAGVGPKTTLSRLGRPGQPGSVPGRPSSGMEASHPPPEEQVDTL